jgi:hypothetical protein
MTPAVNAREGLYVSYNEELYGPFADAVQISNELGCVTWFEKFQLNPGRLRYPTDITVRLSGQERYFRGILLAMVRAETLPANFEEGERNHRPPQWVGIGYPLKDVKRVLFISHLRDVPKPQEIEGCAPPEGPQYMCLSLARAQASAVLF